MTNQLPDDAMGAYRALQREVRAAIDRCADGLGAVMVPTPSNPDEPEIALDVVLRRMVAGADNARMASRLLMLLAEAARQQDAVALFLVERIATSHAAHEAQAMVDAGLIGEPNTGVALQHAWAPGHVA